MSIDEFEALVRGEWRRRLGPESYGRSHPGSLVRALGRATMDPNELKRTTIQSEIDWVIADLSQAGVGRQQIRHELAVLARAIRTVLGRADVSGKSGRRLVTPLRKAMNNALSFPDQRDEVLIGPALREARQGS